MGKKQYINFNNLIPLIGLELEFYLTKNGNKIFSSDQLIDEFLQKFSSKHNFKIEREQGSGQIEVKTAPSSDIISIIQNNLLVKKNIAEIADSLGLQASFLAQPFLDDCGSALQINLSLWNEEQNLFAKKNNEESEILLNAIAGALEFTNKILSIVATKPEDFLRYDLKLNRNLFKNKKYTAPVNVSWGYDNRSCLIRVPKSSKPEERRLEYRLAPANAELEPLINFILQSVRHGIENNLKAPEPIYGNAFDYELVGLKGD